MSSGPSLATTAVLEILERAVADSPADATELVWLERVHGSVPGAHAPSFRPPLPLLEGTLLARVEERGRYGFHVTSPGSGGELADAIRLALACARHQPSAGPRAPLAPPEPLIDAGSNGLFDPEIAALIDDPPPPELVPRAPKGIRTRLTWTVGRLLVVNSLGLRRAVAATAAVLEATAGGKAALREQAVARNLRLLPREDLIEGLQERGGGAATAAPPAGPLPIVLAPTAVAALVSLLGRSALSPETFHDGSSFLAGRLGQSLFDPALSLTDDGTDPTGQPFPCDYFGFAKRPVELLAGGVLRTPVVDWRLSKQLGLPPTPHAVAPEVARAAHLFVGSGGLTRDELLGRADGGLWVGRLDRLGAPRGPAGELTGRAREVWRIRDGRLAERLPDLRWEARITTLLAQLLGIGRERRTFPEDDGFFGGITAPALALPETDGSIFASLHQGSPG
jgi:PmbA protein